MQFFMPLTLCSLSLLALQGFRCNIGSNCIITLFKTKLINYYKLKIKSKTHKKACNATKLASQHSQQAQAHPVIIWL